MEIKSEIFQIDCVKPTLDFIEDWFKLNNIEPVRYAIVDVSNGSISLEVAYIV